jgi:SAM-dependent methyltransferase
MLIKEAIWLGEAIHSISLRAGAVFLNFGSQTERYNKENSHIYRYLLNPIKKNYTLKNFDIRAGKGVDIVGDIYDDSFFLKFKEKKFDCILLCNVLEHVTNIKLLCNRISELLKPGGIILFSGPYSYPIHYDPIDNGFRPTVDQVCELFPNFKIIRGEIITDYTYSYYVMRSFKRFFNTILRASTPFYKYKKWKKVVIPKFKYWNRNFQVTCVILRKVQ